MVQRFAAGRTGLDGWDMRLHPIGGSMEQFEHYQKPALTRRETAEGEIVESVVWCALILGLAWAPFWYGSNDPVAWGINAIIFPGLAIFYELSLLIRNRSHPVALQVVMIPAILLSMVIVWIAIQLATWIPGFFANPIWSLAGGALTEKLRGSISADRDLTNLALLRLLTGASVFWLALQLCRDTTRSLRLIAAIAAIGVLYGLYGLVVVKTGQLAVLNIPVDEKRLSSTFYNYNSFATYAGLCLVAASGLTLSLYRQGIVRGAGWRLRLSSFIDTTGHRGAVLIAACFVMLVALLMTGSRGGVVSTGIALAILGALSLWQGRKHDEALNGTVLFGIFLAAATLVAFGSTFVDKIDTRGLSDPNRLLVYRLTLQSILDKPFLGFGYGTFPVVFPMYRDRSLSVDGVWTQAHDTYLEVLQGLGLVFGAALIAAIVVLVIYALKGSLRRRENAVVPQITVGAACLVGIHSFVDFSLQIEAVALLFMALLGAGVAQAESSRRSLAD